MSDLLDIQVDEKITHYTLFEDEQRILDFLLCVDEKNKKSTCKLPGEREGDKEWTVERHLAGLGIIQKIFDTIHKEPKPEEPVGDVKEYLFLVNGKTQLNFALSDFHLHFYEDQDKEAILHSPVWWHIGVLNALAKLEIESVTKSDEYFDLEALGLTKGAKE